MRAAVGSRRGQPPRRPSEIYTHCIAMSRASRLCSLTSKSGSRQPILAPVPKSGLATPCVQTLPPAPRPPPKQEEQVLRKRVGGNHCRWFNFGKTTSKCTFGGDCRYWHIDADNWDHIENVQVHPDDKKYVTPDVMEKLRPIFVAETAKHRGGKRERTSEEPPVQKRRSDPCAQQMTEPLLQQWLDNARSEEMVASSKFLRDIVKLKFDNAVVKKKISLRRGDAV